MVRSFRTHEIRPTRELSDSLWTFSAAGKVIRTAVPGCWENIPGFEAYRGEGIYQTEFEAAGNVRLTFFGVSHTAAVFLDGRELCRHYNAYTAFSCVVTDLNPGQHVLQVRADNSFGSDSALHIPNDYMSYGGISRPVVLEQLGNIYIDHVHITPSLRDGICCARVSAVVCSLSDKAEHFDLHLDIAGQTVTLSEPDIAPGEQREITVETECADAALWDLGQPNLYFAKAVLMQDGTAVDDLIERFGFREITVRGEDILLNGRKVRLKGVCRHEDHPQFGCALPFAAQQFDLGQIIDLGANAIRAVHYPSDPLFLDLCDEHGIFVWQENHARGLGIEQMQNPNFRSQSLQVTGEMVTQHYNHPCICIWGILNECASDHPYGFTCYEEELALIRRMDSSRPASFASCRIKSDICLGLADIVSFNIYPLWYHDTPPKDYLADLWNWIQESTEGNGKPFLITEVGAGGIYGYRNGHDGRWTEDYQAHALEQQLRAILSYERCQGVFIWQYCDIRVSEECWAGRPRTMNNKGLVDEYRRRKLAYDKVKEIYTAFSDEM